MWFLNNKKEKKLYIFTYIYIFIIFCTNNRKDIYIFVLLMMIDKEEKEKYLDKIVSISTMKMRYTSAIYTILIQKNTLLVLWNIFIKLWGLRHIFASAMTLNIKCESGWCAEFGVKIIREWVSEWERSGRDTFVISYIHYIYHVFGCVLTPTCRVKIHDK